MTNNYNNPTSNAAAGIMIRINTADQAAIIRFCLANYFYSVDGSMEHSKRGFALLSNLIRFPEDFVFLVTQK